MPKAEQKASRYVSSAPGINVKKYPTPKPKAAMAITAKTSCFQLSFLTFVKR